MTDKLKALVERLRTTFVLQENADGARITQIRNPDGNEAADTIETQAREIERLREALENVLAHRYGNWCDIARAALGDTQ